MGAPETPKVPAAVRSVYDEVTAMTGAFCAEHLDEEYAGLCAKLAAKLAGMHPSPLMRGDRRIWAAGILYAIGRVNFLADPKQELHLRTEELAELTAVQPATVANKGRMIMELLDIDVFEPEYSRRDLLEKHALTWMVDDDGFIVEARS